MKYPTVLRNALHNIINRYVLPIASGVFIFCSVSGASGATEMNPEQPPLTAASDSLRIPTYECYPVTRNYVFNQTVIATQRWATIGMIAGGTIGAIIDFNAKSFFIPNTFIIGLAGMGLGTVSGIPIGIVKGLQLQRIKKSNPLHHAYRCRFGYEYNFFEFGLIPDNKSTTRMHRNSCFSIVYRPLQQNALLPSKISLGFFSDWWGRGSDYEVSSYGRLYVYKTEAIVHYNFAAKRLVFPYWAVGIGYAWGHETEDLQEIDSLGMNEYRIASPVLRGYVGCEINVFDFAYMDLKLGYEAIGPYLAAHNKQYYPYGQNVLLGISFGTYIF